jgi:uncharacterized protein (UPF0218 family)
MLATIVEGEKPVLIVAVGDAVSRTMLSAGVRVDVMVIDHREQRQPVGGFAPKKQKLIHAFNRPGTIDPAAVQAVSDAVNHGNAVVTIEGEEDLLTLPAVLSAPIGAMVVYGQPNEGIVVVRIDSKKKSEIRGIVDSMSAV